MSAKAFDYSKVPLDMEHKPSSRVSLNPQFLQYDPVCDSGINVGNNNREQTKDFLSRVIPLQGAISIGNKFEIELKDGASCPGDYLYRSGSFKWDVESGMWGIFRVLKQGIGCRCRRKLSKIFGGDK